MGTEKLPEALYNRAIALDGLGLSDKALADLILALEIRPDWPPATNMISMYDKNSKITKNK
jgi:lipoprotein NlpI